MRARIQVLSSFIASKQIQYENRDRIIGVEVCSSSQMLALLVSKFSMRTRIEVLVLDAGACDWTHCGLRARTVAIFGERGCYAQVARTAEELP